MAKPGPAKGTTWAPLPARAMADDTLTALDLRVLAALAVHDRFGANGSGCHASHTRLAALVGCHLKSLSRSLSTLADRGYIEGHRHPIMKRLRVYRVLYTAADGAVMKRPIGNGTATNERPESGPIGNGAVPDGGPIGNRDFSEAEQFQEDEGVEVYSGNRGIHSVETVKENSAEAASASADATMRIKDSESKKEGDAALLAKAERWLKTLNGELSQRDETKLAELVEVCGEIHERRCEFGDDVGGWAGRVRDQAEMVLWGI